MKNNAVENTQKKIKRYENDYLPSQEYFQHRFVFIDELKKPWEQTSTNIKQDEKRREGENDKKT